MQAIVVYPQRRGLELFVGPLEAAIMRAFWNGARTSRAVYEIVRASYAGARTDDIRFTTVTSTITRLYDRGFLIRAGDKTGYTYGLYYDTETAFVSAMIRDTLTALFESYPRETGLILVETVRRAKETHNVA